MLMLYDLTRDHTKVFSLSNKCFPQALSVSVRQQAILLVSLSARVKWWPWERSLQDHIFHHHKLPHGVRLQRPSWWRTGETVAKPLTHEEIAHVSTP